MKLIHIADLHFGKSLHGVSLIDNGDQPNWAEQFLKLVDEEQPDAVLIAGDVYDRGAPSGQAVELLDKFLTGIAKRNVPVMMVSGNHDSGSRLAFASALLEARQLYISGSVAGGVKHVTLEDKFGPVDFWLLPYVFPALAADALGDDSIRDYDTAVRRLLEAEQIDFTRRNVLIAHQNVMANGTAAQRGGSETMVGGVGEVDYTAFDGFDYVALGHIHAAQPMGRRTVRYAGSPLCYHFSELRSARKGPVIIELGKKGTEPEISVREILPLHPLREVTGSFAEVLKDEQEKEAIPENAYVRIVLTDDLVPTDAGDQLRAVLAARGAFLCELSREPVSRDGEDAMAASGGGQKQLAELFADFYRDRTGGNELDEKQRALISFAAEQLRGNEPESAVPDGDIEAIVRFAMGQGD